MELTLCAALADIRYDTSVIYIKKLSKVWFIYLLHNH